MAERASELTKVGGVFGKIMAEASARAKEYRAVYGPVDPPSENGHALSAERVSGLRGLPSAKWGKTFDSFDLTIAPGMADAHRAAQLLASGEARSWCLVLVGSYGCGKTHLAYASANYRREHQMAYRMITAPALMAQFRNAIDEKRMSIEHNAPVAYGPEDWVRVYSETPALLILDDFGAQQDTEWAITQLFSVLNARYEGELPTLITTNRTIQQLDPRIASRCKGGIVKCVGSDQRGKVKR